MTKKNLIILFFILMVFSSCGSPFVRWLIYRGDPMARHRYKDETIFPLRFDVSKDNRIYFNYMDSSGITIRSLDMETDSIRVLSNRDSMNSNPVVSNTGKYVLYNGGLLSGNKYYLTDRNGRKTYKVLDNKNIFLSSSKIIKDDKYIYFIGGSTFNDTSIASSINYKCQDIFRMDIDGKNLKRLTFFRITSWISYFFIEGDEKSILLSIDKEDWESDFGNYRKKIAGIIDRLPFKAGLYRYFPEDKKLEKLLFKQIADYYDYVFWEKEERFISPSSFGKLIKHPFKNYLLSQTYRGIYKFDLDKMTAETFVDSINGIPYEECPDSIRIYNIKFTADGKKLVGGVGDTDNYQLVLLDIATKTIEKRFVLDSSKVIPFKEESR